MNRRIAALLLALVPVLVLGVLGSVVVVPFVSLGPGPTFNTLSQVDGKDVVMIDGVPVDHTEGNLNMTTVAVRDHLTLFDALALWASGRDQLVPRDEVYPPSKTKEQVAQENAADFQQSEDSAEVAALTYLKYPKAAKVVTVKDGPAAKILQPGDVITSVNGKPTPTADTVTAALAGAKPGDVAQIAYDRAGQSQSSAITLGSDEGKAVLKIEVADTPVLPGKITFNLADIGGPSAGLMFTLAVIDKLTPGELSGGHFVAGTGTISDDGTVGPIGGITHKLLAAHDAGATTFLVPSDNCSEAKSNDPDGLRLVKVENLSGAVDALNSLNAGGDAPSC